MVSSCWLYNILHEFLYVAGSFCFVSNTEVLVLLKYKLWLYKVEKSNNFCVRIFYMQTCSHILCLKTIGVNNFSYFASDEMKLELDAVPSPEELQELMQRSNIVTMASSPANQPVVKFFFYAQHISQYASESVFQNFSFRFQHFITSLWKLRSPSCHLE